jgi:dipeptidase
VNGLPSIIETYSPYDFDHNSAWWAFNFVANWAEKKYSYMHPEIKARQEFHEEASIELTRQTDEKALTLLNENTEALGDYLRQICSKNAESIVADWWKLSEYLIVKYNDGYITIPGNAAQPVGYPQEWLDRTKWVNGPTEYEKNGEK